jgi:2-keto-myo-inositol isomerase
MKNVMQEHLNLFETETFRNGVPRLHSGAGFADDFRYEQVGQNFAAAGVGEFGIDCDGGVGRVEDYGFGISSGVGGRIALHGGTKAGAPFVFCLNTSTLRGQKLGIVKEIEVAAQAGFQAIEPWVGSIEDYVKGGGSLKDLKRKIADLGLTVESAIGFPEWIVDDEARRAKGLEQAKREMDLVAQIGGKRLAAPPAGATNEPGLDLAKAAERYRALLEAGDAIGVTPELELWGFSKNLHRLSECAFVAIESGHPKACILTDVFHLYKGGSDFRSIRLLSAQAIQLVHLNDFPAEPPREKIDDSYRVFPGRWGRAVDAVFAGFAVHRKWQGVVAGVV